jgi:hypothetical protein
MLLDMYDASTPIKPAGFQVTAGYIGHADATPHVWTAGEWEQYGEALKLPIYVPSAFHTGTWDAAADAQDAISQLRFLGVPVNSTVALDMETKVEPGYITEFNAALDAAGFLVMTYGSSDYLFQNPKTLGGYWVANWNGVREQAANCLATQYEEGTGYDKSVIDDSVALWGRVIVPPVQNVTVSISGLSSGPVTIVGTVVQ